MSTVSVAVDVGGTFTDVSLVDRDSGQIWVAKTPSTPREIQVGFLNGIQQALRLAGRDPSAISLVLHGTTVATNAILESKGAATGLITTEGFKYVLEIGRHDIPRRANLYSWIKPPRPVPPELIVEVAERLDVTGAELLPLDEDGVRRAVRHLRAWDVQAIAICFIHSYADAAHERRAREIVLEEHPAAVVTISSDVLPVFREYERTMATVLNAYVMPKVSEYVAALDSGLREHGIGAPFLIMKSNGGVISGDEVVRQPVYTALSGPAAGVIGAAELGRLVGLPDVISIDVGGTSADICLIRGAQPEVTTEGQIGEWPLQLPMVDIHTIGAGGGSVAQVTPAGRLIVGPESAGAEPGPVCYGRGGTEPTVTDANLVLGRIPPHLLGGTMRLDVDAARAAIEERIARPLGLDLFDIANGILEIIDNNMMGAIRLVSVERGYDPRTFTLLPFGGAGPLHGARLARLLDVPRTLVPRNPGVLSTFGLLATDIRNDYARTCIQRPPEIDLELIGRVFRELEATADAWLAREGIPPENRLLERQADLRYLHQGFELTVPWDAERVDEAALAAAVQMFHDRHEQLYTYAALDTSVEIVTVRVRAAGALSGLRLPILEREDPRTEHALIGRRPVFFAERGGFVETPIFARAELGLGARLAGPAVVEQQDSTVVILPGQSATVDRYANLLIEPT